MIATIPSRGWDPPTAGLVEQARVLRREFACTAAEVDARGEYPVANMQRIFECGLDRLIIPIAFGGLAQPAHLTTRLTAIAEILTELAAGESSTAQIWMVHGSVARQLFAGFMEVPEQTLRQLAHEVLTEGARFISSASEPGGKRQSYRTAGKFVPGGLLVNGAKYFGTGSDGARYAQVPLLLEGYSSVEEGGLYFALVRLDASGVHLHHDWDNMGQRATASQAITYENVFVPDGFHYGIRGGAKVFYAANSVLGPASQTRMNAVILGMGFGALEALVEYTRDSARPLSSGDLPGAAADPIVRWHVGRYSAQLAGARALQREVASRLECFSGDPEERAELSVQVMRAKACVVDATLEAATGLHRVAGARATATKYRFDRFWRNGRTLSVHDPIDAKLPMIGAWELERQPPPVSWLS